MGCVESKFFNKKSHFFQVMNVDEEGKNLNACKLEVTNAELILYQKHKNAVRWPLKCLKRYGYEKRLFSCELGRRCPTGPGIYVFECHNAEGLFNTLQYYIQKQNNEELIQKSAKKTMKYLAENNLSNSLQQSRLQESLNCHMLPKLEDYNNCHSDMEYHSKIQCEYNINSESINNSENNIKNLYVNCAKTYKDDNSHLLSQPCTYVNLNLDDTDESEERLMCIDISNETITKSNSFNNTQNTINLSEINKSPLKSKPVTYVELDLDSTQSDDQSNAKVSLNNAEDKSQNYATVDFAQTLALNVSNIPASDLDFECVRATRHNPRTYLSQLKK